MNEVGQTDSVSAVNCKNMPHRQRVNKSDDNSTDQTATKIVIIAVAKHDPDKCRARGCQSKKRTNFTTNKCDVTVVEDSDEDNENVYVNR